MRRRVHFIWGEMRVFDGRVPGVFTRRPTDLFEKYANAKWGG